MDMCNSYQTVIHPNNINYNPNVSCMGLAEKTINNIVDEKKFVPKNMQQ